MTNGSTEGMGTVVCRQYAAAGAFWALLAGAAALAMALALGFGLAPAWPALGVGRLHATYHHVLLLGAISLPLAGGLLDAAGLPVAPPAARRRARWAWWLWNAGLALGVVAIALGGLGADPFGVLPSPWSAGLLWLAAVVWAAALWSAAARPPGGAAVFLWFGLAATVGLLAYLTVGLLGAVGLGGFEQAIASAVAARGLVSQWAALAALGTAAAVLPAAVGRPLYGRRAAVLGWALWVTCGSLAAARDLPPDLVPGWLARLVGAAAVLWLAGAVALIALLMGSWIGSGSASEPRWPLTAGRDPAVGFVAVGALAVLAAAIFEAALLPPARGAFQFTAWDSASNLAPPHLGLLWVAAGAAYGLWERGGTPVNRRLVRWHLGLAVIGGLLFVLPLAPVAMAEAAGGPPAVLGRLAVRLQLPGIALLAAAAVLWAANAARVARARPNMAVAWRPPAAADPAAPPAGLVVGAALGVQVVTLFVTLLLPLAGATAGAAPRAGAAPAAALPGERVFLAEGCTACHTLRVRAVAADQSFGFPTGPQDQVIGRVPRGVRRIGPDLARAGDRYGSRDELTARLAVHGGDGWPAFPWLIDQQVPTARGADLVDYLAELRHTDARP